MKLKCLLFLKDILNRYKMLGWRGFVCCFTFINLNISLHCLLSCIFSNEKSTVTLISACLFCMPTPLFFVPQLYWSVIDTYKVYTPHTQTFVNMWGEDVLTDLTLVIISQYMYVSNQHVYTLSKCCVVSQLYPNKSGGKRPEGKQCNVLIFKRKDTYLRSVRWCIFPPTAFRSLFSSLTFSNVFIMRFDEVLFLSCVSWVSCIWGLWFSSRLEKMLLMFHEILLLLFPLVPPPGTLTACMVGCVLSSHSSQRS